VVRKEDTPIPVTPEIAPSDKNKPKRSAKPRREQSQNQSDATIQSHPAPERAQPRLDPDSDPPQAAPVINGAPADSRPKSLYDWDRTQAEDTERAEQLRISRIPFPQPDAKTLTLPKFCEYANKLRELPVAKYARLYVRRWKPVLLPEEKEDAATGLKREGHPSETKLTITKDDLPLNEQRILDTVGVGDYTIRLNDNRLPWDRGTVAHCEKFATIRDYDRYPPTMDITRLDWNDDDNQVYIKWAQSHGVLTRPAQMGKEQADMAQASVVETLTNDGRAERARTDQLHQEARLRSEQEARDAKEALARAQAAAAQTVKVEGPKSSPTPAGELMSVVTAVAELSKSLQPARDDSLSKYLEVQAEREQTQRERDKEDRAELRRTAAAERERADKLQSEMMADFRAKAQAPAPIAPVQLTEIEALERDVKKIVLQKQIYKEMLGRGSVAEEEPRPSSIDKWLEAAPLITPVVGQLVGGIFQTILTGLQVWERNHYNDAVSRKGGDLKMPPTAEKVEPGKPIAPQAPAQTPEQIAQQQQWNQIIGGVQMLAPHLVRFLDKGKSGADLAEFIIENAEEQRTSYDRIRHVAESLVLIGMQLPGTDLEKFMGACRFVFEKIPPLWAKVGGLPTMPQFLADFYNYDAILAKAQEEQQQ